jgi:hypothetical protein
MATRDPKLDEAVPAIMSRFEDRYHRPRKRTHYIGQLQVLLEDQFFPWIVYNAAMELLKNGNLKRTIVSTKYADKVTFLYHHKLTERQMRTRFRNTVSLIDRYSHPNIAKALGRHLEALVKAELRAQGFDIKAQNSNEYRERKWTRTNHDLDFIAEHRSGRLNIGVEVKNTLSVPEREEIQTKIDLSHHLNLTPVFATRWMKPYVKLILDQGGFSWFFKTQIYPLGFEKLTQNIWTRLGLPVTVRTDLPEKTIKVLADWVARQTTTTSA